MNLFEKSPIIEVMRRRFFLFCLIFSTALAVVALSLILFNFSPATTNLILFLFYLTLFLSAAGVFGLVNIFSRYFFKKRKKIASPFLEINFNQCFRQGIFLAVILIFILLFNDLKILKWWSALIVLGVILGIEGYLYRSEKIKAEI